MIFKKIKGYVSELDRLLQARTNRVKEPKSVINERNKNAEVAKKRDNACSSNTVNIWDE